MRMNKYLMPLVVLAALLGTVWIARAAGYWQTSGREMIDPDQPLTSADIRGWMSLEYVSDGFGIAPAALYDLLGIPESTPLGIPLKDLEDIVEVSTVRALIDQYLGTNSAITAGTPDEPTSPASVPTTEHVPGTETGQTEDTAPEPTPLPAGGVLAAAEIKGWMTLREVSEQCDVPLEELLAALELPAGIAPDTVLRDLHDQVDGFEVSRVREMVADLQAR